MSQRLVVSETVCRDTLRTLRSYWRGRRKHEGVCFWLGIERGDVAVVTTSVAPQAETSPGHFHVGAVDNARMIWAASQAGLLVLAQVHSHPSLAGVGHSRGDDRDAFMPSEGYYSLVVPDYASGDPPVSKWGVHRYESGRFRRLTSSEAAQTLTIVPAHLDLRR